MTKKEFIEVRPSAAGETVYIAGTRTPVRHIVGYYKIMQEQMVVERICAELPYLTPEQVYAALEYAREHPEQIEQELADDAAVLERLGEG
jgi:uncharacterized protein (DUF433 family)